MNKAQLIDAIAAEAGLTKADSKKALDALIKSTTVALKKGDRVALVGFGSFSVAKRSARTGRNPQTGKEIKIAAKKVVKFKAGLSSALQYQSLFDTASLAEVTRWETPNIYTLRPPSLAHTPFSLLFAFCLC
jgi:DNA-binding protein HU-beta